MAKRSHHTVGLDIEPGGITAVQIGVDGRTVERAAFSPLEPGIVREGEIIDVEALAGALRALWKDNRGLRKRVRVGVASQKIALLAQGTGEYSFEAWVNPNNVAQKEAYIMTYSGPQHSAMG